VFRSGLYTWQELGDHLRFDGRVDQWDDQDATGISWELKLTLRNWLLDHGELAFSLYNADGLYVSGPGARAALIRHFSRGVAGIAYDIMGVNFADDGTGHVQHAIHANVDVDLRRGRSGSVFTDYRFDGEQDSVQGGILFQKRF